MPSGSESCAKCAKQDNLKRCSKCLSAWYCSRECQLADWKAHKKGCHPPEGSDGPKASKNQDGSDTTTPTGPNPTTLPKSNESNFVLGVKLHPSTYSSNISSHGRRARFVEEKFPPNHPIFTRGELCPFTALYGIPIIILSESMVVHTKCDENQPAVYLRIEANDGFAPPHWQMQDPGTCYVVRKDRKPLSKEVVEAMYQFHSSILGTDYFMDKMCGNTPYEVTPKVFQTFSDRYWREEASIRKQYMDGADGRW